MNVMFFAQQHPAAECWLLLPSLWLMYSMIDAQYPWHYIVHTNSLFNSQLCLTKMLLYNIIFNRHINYKAFNAITSINVYSMHRLIIISMQKMLINVIHYWFYIILLHNTAPIDLGCGIADGWCPYILYGYIDTRAY